MKINTILLAITLLLFVGAGCSRKTSVLTANTDNELFDILRKPLAETVMFQPFTFHATFVDDTTYLSPRKKMLHQMMYTFYGNMTELPYTLFLKRNSLCKGNDDVAERWELLTPPKCKDSVITLRSFIVQMVTAKNNNDPQKTNEATWNTSVYTWNLSDPDKDGYRLIDVHSTEGYRWQVRIKT